MNTSQQIIPLHVCLSKDLCKHKWTPVIVGVTGGDIALYNASIIRFLQCSIPYYSFPFILTLVILSPIKVSENSHTGFTLLDNSPECIPWLPVPHHNWSIWVDQKHIMGRLNRRKMTKMKSTKDLTSNVTFANSLVEIWIAMTAPGWVSW